jgi:hypothetical protein
VQQHAHAGTEQGFVDDRDQDRPRFGFDPDVVKEALFAARENSQEYKERAEFLISKKYKKDVVKEYFGKLFPSYSTDPEKKAKGNRNVDLGHGGAGRTAGR